MDRDQVLPNILHAIGKTPLVKLNHIPQAYGIKCEMCKFLSRFFKQPGLNDSFEFQTQNANSWTPEAVSRTVSDSAWSKMPRKKAFWSQDTPLLSRLQETQASALPCLQLSRATSASSWCPKRWATRRWTPFVAWELKSFALPQLLPLTLPKASLLLLKNWASKFLTRLSLTKWVFVFSCLACIVQNDKGQQQHNSHWWLHWSKKYTKPLNKSKNYKNKIK